MFSYGSGEINKQTHSWALPTKWAFWVVDIHIDVAFRLCHRLCDMVR